MAMILGLDSDGRAIECIRTQYRDFRLAPIGIGHAIGPPGDWLFFTLIVQAIHVDHGAFDTFGRFARFQAHIKARLSCRVLPHCELRAQ